MVPAEQGNPAQFSNSQDSPYFESQNLEQWFPYFVLLVSEGRGEERLEAFLFRKIKRGSVKVLG